MNNDENKTAPPIELTDDQMDGIVGGQVTFEKTINAGTYVLVCKMLTDVNEFISAYNNNGCANIWKMFGSADRCNNCRHFSQQLTDGGV